MSFRLVCRNCGANITVGNDGEYHHSLLELDSDDHEVIASKKMLPIRSARLNAKYALVKLTYLQAKMLFLAADQMTDDADEDALHNIGWSGIEARAFRQAMENLGETRERWPS